MWCFILVNVEFYRPVVSVQCFVFVSVQCFVFVSVQCFVFVSVQCFVFVSVQCFVFVSVQCGVLYMGRYLFGIDPFHECHAHATMTSS